MHIVIIIFRFQGTVFTFVARLEGIYFLEKKKAIHAGKALITFRIII